MTIMHAICFDPPWCNFRFLCEMGDDEMTVNPINDGTFDLFAMQSGIGDFRSLNSKKMLQFFFI
jgi:hypothetical protein